MLVCLVAALRRDGQAGIAAVCLSLPVAALVELSRLLHRVPLDRFRHTLAGVLLPGRVFDPRNIIAYGLGIVLAALFRQAQDRSGRP